jgi:hypothetical protein
MTPVQSAVKKRSVVLGGRKTSTSLENEFWEALRDIAQSRQRHCPHCLQQSRLNIDKTVYPLQSAYSFVITTARIRGLASVLALLTLSGQI